MKRRTFSLLPGVLLLTVAAQAAPPLRVLFIGNSYTYFNNLPEIFAGLAMAGQPALRVEAAAITVGGSTLAQHRQRGEAQKAIREGHWDYVVLQEQSALGTPLLVNGASQPTDPAGFWQSVRDFDREIKAAGAKTVLYHTWAVRAAPESQPMLDYAYLKIASELGAIDVPAGPAWQESMHGTPAVGVNLYYVDGAHPSQAGSYLAACEFYATLFGKSPVGLPATVSGTLVTRAGRPRPGETGKLVSLTAERAAWLQKAAWRVHEMVKAGAYADLKPPDPPELPAPAAGRAIDPAELEGTFSGNLILWASPARMELRLARDAQHAWSGRVKITFGGTMPDIDTALSQVEVTKDGFRFAGGTVTFRGVATDSGVGGVAEIRGRDERLTATGSWDLRRL
ncbi:MAG: SGNH/GDSL hydrolase family protein [Acidobacteriia bacterium]|nr:SGNH/GDSL hydrolase family protein [Terriglobia bacterium]